MFFSVCFYPISLYCLLFCTIQISNAKHEYRSSQRRYGRCGIEKYQCHSGECIEEDLLCDGIPDCFDKSDETEYACSEMNCPGFTYRCNYGACVISSAKCDGTRDCFDGSDEASCYTDGSTDYAFATDKRKVTNSRPRLPVNCLMPNSPENGKYTIGGKPATYGTGDAVPPFSVLVTNCHYGYHISPPDATYSVCANGMWTPIPSQCSRFAQSTNSAGRCNCYCPLVLIK